MAPVRSARGDQDNVALIDAAENAGIVATCPPCTEDSGPRGCTRRPSPNTRPSKLVTRAADQHLFSRLITDLPSDRRSRTGSSLQVSGFDPAEPTVSSPG